MSMSYETEGSNAMEKEIRILHLEDDAIDAELIHATLESAGIHYKITRVQSSGEFGNALRTGGYDLILADYRLPSYDGISALHYVREKYSDIPFIFISGTMGEDAAIQALTEGATDYVLKQKLSRLAPAVVRALRDAENRAERRRAEETLRESEERFRAVANSANDGIVSTDNQGIIFYWNKAAHAMFGYTDDEILGQSLIVLMPERYQEKYQDVLKHWFTNYENHQLSKTVEAVGRRKDGSEFPIELSAGSWNTREGTFFTGIVRDITERKQVEETLRKSEEKYRTLIQKIQAAVVVHGADTQILTSNSMAQELLGLTGDQMLGKTTIDSAWHFFLEDGTAMPLEKYPVNQVLASRQALRNFIVRVHRPNKENDVWVLVNADPVFGKEDEITQVIVTFVDITERKRAEENLRRSEQNSALWQRIFPMLSSSAKTTRTIPSFI